MEGNKTVRIMGYLIMGSYIVFNFMMIIIADRFDYGIEVAGPYAIYASKSFFITYHVWGIGLCAIGIYTMWKNINRLFMIVLVLMLIVMFYPYFTSSPMDRAKGREAVKKEQMDSVTIKIPPVMKE